MKIILSTLYLVIAWSGLTDKKDVHLINSTDSFPVNQILLQDSTQRIDTPDKKKQYAGKTITIYVRYSAIECECAQWFETKYLKEGGAVAERFFVEPANKGLINADTLWDGVHLPLQVKLTGYFYEGKRIPQNYHPAKGSPEPARVFRYKRITIISPYYRNALHKSK